MSGGDVAMSEAPKRITAWEMPSGRTWSPRKINRFPNDLVHAAYIRADIADDMAVAMREALDWLSPEPAQAVRAALEKYEAAAR